MSVGPPQVPGLRGCFVSREEKFQNSQKSRSRPQGPRPSEVGQRENRGRDEWERHR